MKRYTAELLILPNDLIALSSQSCRRSSVRLELNESTFLALMIELKAQLALRGLVVLALPLSPALDALTSVMLVKALTAELYGHLS